MSERIRGSYDDALYKSTYTLLYFILKPARLTYAIYFITVPTFSVLFTIEYEVE